MFTISVRCAHLQTLTTRPVVSRVLQVVGALHQPLAHNWRHQGDNDGTAAEALFNFIFHHRAIIVSGVWDRELDRYVEHGPDFTVVLKRSRLYSSVKQTPIHLQGEQDAQANDGHLIDSKSRRGTKVSVATFFFVYEVSSHRRRQRRRSDKKLPVP